MNVVNPWQQPAAAPLFVKVPTPAFDLSLNSVNPPSLINVPPAALESPLKLVDPGTRAPPLLIKVPRPAVELPKNAVTPLLKAPAPPLLVKVPLPAVD